MRQYRHLWLVERDGSTLGWGHIHRRDDAETEAVLSSRSGMMYPCSSRE
jgi:hypothetical protein